MGPKSPAPVVASRTPRAQHDRRLIILSNGKLSIDDLRASLSIERNFRPSSRCPRQVSKARSRRLNKYLTSLGDKNIFANFARARDYKNVD